MTLFWFASLVLLAGWTGASVGLSPFNYNSYAYPLPYANTVDLSERNLDEVYPSNHPWEPFKRHTIHSLRAPRTMVRVHGLEARYSAQILAGISSTLAGITLSVNLFPSQ